MVSSCQTTRRRLLRSMRLNIPFDMDVRKSIIQELKFKNGSSNTVESFAMTEVIFVSSIAYLNVLHGKSFVPFMTNKMTELDRSQDMERISHRMNYHHK